jgi:hypothetical protein
VKVEGWTEEAEILQKGRLESGMWSPDHNASRTVIGESKVGRIFAPTNAGGYFGVAGDVSPR